MVAQKSNPEGDFPLLPILYPFSYLVVHFIVGLKHFGYKTDMPLKKVFIPLHGGVN